MAFRAGKFPTDMWSPQTLRIQAASLWRRSYSMVILDRAVPAGRRMMEAWLNTGGLDLVRDARGVVWGHSQYCPVPPSSENFFIAVSAPCLHPVQTSSCSSFVSFQWFPKEEEETNSHTPYCLSVFWGHNTPPYAPLFIASFLFRNGGNTRAPTELEWRGQRCHGGLPGV